jgi:hypothetical protein
VGFEDAGRAGSKRYLIASRAPDVTTNPGDDSYPKAELVADARSLAETLEDTHPDPYAGHGGRVHFHRRLSEAVRAIPADGESVAAFYPRVAELAGRVRDGHTDVSAPKPPGGGTRGTLPIGFRVVGSGLYVDEAYAATCEHLLGSRLEAVEGVPVSTLVERTACLDGADNVVHDRTNLTRSIRDVTPLGWLFDEPVTAPSLTLETPDGTTVERDLAPLEAPPDEPVATLEATLALPETAGEPAAGFLDDDRSSAVLVLPDMFSYREAVEALRGLGHARAEAIAKETYATVVDEAVPDELDDVVAALPSALDVLTDLVEQMAAAETERLVVDTRYNNGGTSVLGHILTYVLHGWEGILRGGEAHRQVPKDSALYRERIGSDGPVGDTDNPAGFDFDSYFERDDPERRRERVGEWLAHSPTVAAELEAGEYEGHYRPETVVVVTSATTYSAGAEPAFTLSELGATVVGVAPSQAPNAPRDALRTDLPNTGLAVRTSYRHVESLPHVDGRVFTPDVELTPERFEAMGRPADAGVRLALDGPGQSE